MDSSRIYYRTASTNDPRPDFTISDYPDTVDLQCTVGCCFRFKWGTPEHPQHLMIIHAIGVVLSAAAPHGCATDADCVSSGTAFRCCGVDKPAENCPNVNSSQFPSPAPLFRPREPPASACVLPGTTGVAQCACVAPAPAACCGGSQSSCVAAQEPGKRQWLMIGDSISYGCLTPARAGVEAHDVQVVHNPTNAANVIWGAHCLSSWLGPDPARWDVITFQFGLHDLALDNERVEPALYGRLFANITERLAVAAPMAKLIWVTTTPVPLGIAGACNKTTGRGGCPPRRASDPPVYNAAAAAAVAGTSVAAKVEILDLYSRVVAKCGTNYTLCPANCTERMVNRSHVGDCFQLPGNVHYTSSGWADLGAAYVSAVLRVLERPTTQLLAPPQFVPGPPIRLLAALLPSPVIGLDFDTPQLSWAFGPTPTASEKRGIVQFAYQIQLGREDNRISSSWDTGRVVSNRSTGVLYAGPRLLSGTAYWWRVRWWSAPSYSGAPSLWSMNATFVTGLYAPSDWRDAAFLSCGSLSPPPLLPPPPKGEPFWPVQGPATCRHLRATVTVPHGSTVVRVTAFVAAMGYFELSVNGLKAGGAAVLEPGWTQFDRRLNYVAYDVTNATTLIRNGSHTVAFMLGNGWPGHLGHIPAVKMVMKFQLNGSNSSAYFTSAPNRWRGTTAGPILLDDIYGGETYDARREMPGWDLAGFDDASWTPAVAVNDPSVQRAVLSAQTMPPIRRFQLLPAVLVTEPWPGVKVADIGQNIAGWARLSLTNCPAGTTIKLSFSELTHRVDNAGPYCTNTNPWDENGTSQLLDPYHNCTWKRGMANMQMLMCVASHGSITGDRCAVDMYTCKGGNSEVWEPRFTYHGFRFIQIDNVPPSTTFTVEGRVVHSDVEGGGTVTFGGASAPELNQLQSNIQWTQRDNLHSIPTDCPQRTERQGWMADGSVSMEAAYHNFVMGPFYRSWLRSIVDVQVDYPPYDPSDHRGCGGRKWPSPGRLDCLGAITDTVPHPPGTFGARPADPSWSAGFDLTYWYLLRYTGAHLSLTPLMPLIYCFAATVNYAYHGGLTHAIIEL